MAKSSESKTRPESKSDESRAKDKKEERTNKSVRVEGPVNPNPESLSGKPMNDEEHNVPQRDAGNPPDPSLPTPNQSPVQPSAREIAAADAEKPYVVSGVRHEAGEVRHNPGAGTVVEGLGEYSSEPDCPDAAYMAGDCDRSDEYYETRGRISPEDIRAARSASPQGSGEEK